MNLIILAAGRGRRLKSKTSLTPKPLVKFLGKSILEYQISITRKFKSIKPILVLGYKHFLFKNYRFPKVINKEYHSTNMVHSLFKAKKYMNKNLIISYSDIIYSKDILRNLMKKKGDIVVAIDKNFKNYWIKRFRNPLNDVESCKIKNNQILDLGSKVNTFKGIDGQYIGLIKLSSKGSKIFHKVCLDLKKRDKNSVKKMYMTDFLQILIKKGYKLTALNFYSPWIEFDNQNDLKIAEHKNRIKKILGN
jgi:L-glutamine-phosphate cytidylyltransferase